MVRCMRFQDSTVLVTGGGSGIGAGLASAFHARGAKVIVAGRTAKRLAMVAQRHHGMEVEVVDVADPEQVTALAERIASRFPKLDVVVNNAGIQTEMDFTQHEPIDPAIIGREVDINLKGLVYVSNAFLPLLKRQPSARLIHVGSGLGFVPHAAVPVYSATKAAVHSFSISLRRQLKDSKVQVVELIPPVVDTELHRGLKQMPPGAMKLEVFVKKTMAGLDSGKDEISVGLAWVLQIASRLAPGLFLKVVNQRQS